MNLYVKALFMWLLLGVIAFLAAGFRETVLSPRIGSFRAHQVGTLLVCAIYLVVIWAFIRSVRPSETQALVIGAMWTLMTVAFETVMSRIVMGNPWSVVLADYNLLAGRLWLLALLTLLLSPYLFQRIILR